VTLKLDPETERRLLASIQRFLVEKLEQEPSELHARFLLDFALREVAPVAYNRAIADAQAWLLDKVGDLDGSCFAPEFGYWKDR
jgi:uncharacterized protein (DUF2164 family)